MARSRRIRAVRGRAGSSLGQGIVEYGLILGLSALLAAVILLFFGGALSDVLQVIGEAIDASAGR